MYVHCGFGRTLNSAIRLQVSIQLCSKGGSKEMESYSAKPLEMDVKAMMDLK